MTFEDWWNQQMVAEWWETQSVWPSEYNTAKAAWQAAQQAEREKILQIVAEVADDFMHDPWVLACEEIIKRINEINKSGE